jgi:hypothetical protein
MSAKKLLWSVADAPAMQRATNRENVILLLEVISQQLSL